MLRTVETLRQTNDPLPLADLAASFEQVVADVLVQRSIRCAEDHGVRQLVMVGGVAANRRLRQCMLERGDQSGIAVSIAPLDFCTDNAAMIGAAALLRLGQNTDFTSLRAGVAARWPLDEANALYAPDPPF